VSTGEYAVAPIPPKGSLLDEYIKQRWEALLPT
jgi:rRNA maturation protein Nop10